MQVGVVGAGFAGTATAIFLQRQGHDVTLYEGVAEPQAVGAGILLQPTGLAVLEELGLRQEMCDLGARIEALEVRTPRGRLLRLRYADEHPRLFGLGVHRGALFERLLAGARQSGVTLRTGCSVELVTKGDRRWVHYREESGKTSRASHELVVLADGARSTLRRVVAVPQREKPYEWGALWFVAEDPQGIFVDKLHQFVDGTRTMLGFLPTGRLSPGGKPLTSMFWSIRMADIDAWRTGALDDWKAHITRLAPRSAPLLTQIKRHADLLCATYHDVVMPQWHSEGVVVIGDAAHCTSPQLGQGANLGLLDAASLARTMASTTSLAQALAVHGRSRRPTVRYYQTMSRWLTPWFQSGSRTLGILRDPTFWLAGHLPFVYRQMIRTMAGLKRGFFRRSLSVKKVLMFQNGAERSDGSSSPK